MGLDYSICFMVSKKDKDKVLKYISEHGKIEDNNKSCMLYFDLDYLIIKYFQGWDEYKFDYNFRNNLLKNNVNIYYDADWKMNKETLERNWAIDIIDGYKARIGLFDIEFKEVDDNVFIDITAATSDMSQLLEQSRSIHNWIVECSRYANAKLAYIDLEGRISVFTINGKIVDIKIETEYAENLIQRDFSTLLELLNIKYHN